MPEIVVDATVWEAATLYVPAPPVPVPKLATVVGVTPVPVMAVPTPIEPACTAVIVNTVPLMLPVPAKKEVALVFTTKYVVFVDSPVGIVPEDVRTTATSSLYAAVASVMASVVMFMALACVTVSVEAPLRYALLFVDMDSVTPKVPLTDCEPPTVCDAPTVCPPPTV